MDFVNFAFLLAVAFVFGFLCGLSFVFGFLWGLSFLPGAVHSFDDKKATDERNEFVPSVFFGASSKIKSIAIRKIHSHLLTMSATSVNLVCFLPTASALVPVNAFLSEPRMIRSIYQSAAILIQTAIRAYLARSNFRRVQAAVVAQAAARSMLARSNFRRVKAAVVIQAMARGMPARCQLRQVKAAVVIQAMARGVPARRQLRQVKAAVVIQAMARGVPARRQLRQVKAAVVIQATARGVPARRQLRQVKATVVIQATARGMLARRQLRQVKATVVIQATARGMLARRQLRQVKAAIVIQAMARGVPARHLLRHLHLNRAKTARRYRNFWMSLYFIVIAGIGLLLYFLPTGTVLPTGFVLPSAYPSQMPRALHPSQMPRALHPSQMPRACPNKMPNGPTAIKATSASSGHASGQNKHKSSPKIWLMSWSIRIVEFFVWAWLSAKYVNWIRELRPSCSGSMQPDTGVPPPCPPNLTCPENDDPVVIEEVITLDERLRRDMDRARETGDFVDFSNDED